MIENSYKSDIIESTRHVTDLENYFEIIPDLLCITSLEGQFIKVNKAWETILGYTKEELENRNVGDFTHPQDLDANKVIHQQLQHQTHVMNYVNRYRSKDGSYRNLEWTAQSDGEKIYAVVRDVTEKIKQQQHIEYLSYHDVLTGLYNRQFLEEEIKRLNTVRNLPISIIMGDLNRLKLINDAFGHEKGDELIKKTADVLRSCCRLDDLIARWGGDEFIILLPRTNATEAEEILNRILMNCDKEQINSISISISLGAATKLTMDDDMTDVMRSAEDMMYRMKALRSESIRNSIVNTIITTLYKKDPYEEKHAKRVSFLCQKIAKVLGYDKENVKKIAIGGLLHDIGKIAIDSRILEKSGMLTEAEWKEMRKHSEIGARVISSDQEFADIGQAVLAHHERWDGQGYPKGTKWKDIPIAARIIALADSYDTMISQNPYKTKMSKEEAIQEIRKNKGTQFDPEIAEIFVKRVLLHGESKR